MAFQTPMGITTCCNTHGYMQLKRLRFSFQTPMGITTCCNDAKANEIALEAEKSFKPLWGLPPVATPAHQFGQARCPRFKPLWGLPPVATPGVRKYFIIIGVVSNPYGDYHLLQHYSSDGPNA